MLIFFALPLFSHPVRDGDSLCGLLSSCAPIRSAEQHHRDSTRCQKVRDGGAKANRSESQRYRWVSIDLVDCVNDI